MRNRLTRVAMGKDDSPTTMHVEQANPDVSKYETGSPDSWAEGVHKDHPWELENEKGREETGHAKKVRESGYNAYASAVKEAQDLEAKALRCLKIAEVMLGEEAPADAIERQAVDFMTMSNKSVLATLRRMREFEETISEVRVAKIVDAVLEVIAEEEEEEKEEEMKAKKSSEEDEDSKIAAIVEATLEVLAEEEEEEEEMKAKKKAEEEEEEKEEEMKAKKGEEEEKEEKEEEMKAKKSSQEDLVAKITASVLAAMKAEEMKEEMEEKKEKQMKEKKEAKEDEKKEMKEEHAEGEEEHAEAKEEKAEVKASEELSFEDGYDVTASDEDSALLSQLFTTKEAEEETTKEAKIKTLKNVTASTSSSEIDRLASLWNKSF